MIRIDVYDLGSISCFAIELVDAVDYRALPVVLHKAMAEDSKTGNLYEREFYLLHLSPRQKFGFQPSMINKDQQYAIILVNCGDYRDIVRM